MDSSGSHSRRSLPGRSPSPHPSFPAWKPASPEPSQSKTPPAKPARPMAPYNLSRYAKYPRRLVSSPAALSSAATNASKPRTPPPKIPFLSPATKSQDTAPTPLAAIPEHKAVDSPVVPSPGYWEIGPGTGTYDAGAANMLHSSTSSICSFKTAIEKDSNEAVEERKSERKSPHSARSIPSNALVLHSDPDDCYPIDTYAPSRMFVGPPEATTAKTTYDLGTAQEQQPARPAKQPTMFLFIIQGSRNNRQIGKCEYTIRFKSSHGHPSFPNCPAQEEVFQFDALCHHKAIVDRLRIWHRQNPFKPKDARVEDQKYYMSYRERVELRDWNWPGYIGKEWARCLIWDDDVPTVE
ncbi:hypothetical protein ABW21_db0205663 [Orbilia brochopaga]|nr:hypothetical protein ABW21_db0205663 [Drechslerella brochopaga]